MTENAIKSEYFISVSSFADLDLPTFQNSFPSSNSIKAAVSDFYETKH